MFDCLPYIYFESVSLANIEFTPVHAIADSAKSNARKKCEQKKKKCHSERFQMRQRNKCTNKMKRKKRTTSIIGMLFRRESESENENYDNILSFIHIFFLSLHCMSTEWVNVSNDDEIMGYEVKLNVFTINTRAKYKLSYSILGVLSLSQRNVEWAIACDFESIDKIYMWEPIRSSSIYFSVLRNFSL